MPTPFLSTAQDAIDNLSIISGGGATNPEQRDLRLAVVSAYRSLSTLCDWNFYKRAYRLHLSAPYSTGTCSYDHTGGAHERLVTFSTALSSTVQSWVANGKLLIGNVLHEVAALKSSTTVTLAEALNPGQDVSATSFTLLRTSYDMPGDFCGAFDPINEQTQGYCYVTPQEFIAHERVNPTTTGPLYWTIMPSENSYGTWALRVHGYPTEFGTLDFCYQGRGRPIRYTGYETNNRVGTVTISAGSTTVTGSSTAFSSGMIGSILRVSSDTATAPTGLGDLNPWAEQKVITAVASTTSLTVDSAFSSAYTATMYTISDPLDVDESLYDLLLATADVELARIRRHERLGECIALQKKRLRQAMENNAKRKTPTHGNATIYLPWSGGGRIEVGPGLDVTP